MQKKSAFRTYAGKIGGGIARGAITATLVASLIPAPALAEAITATSSTKTYDITKIANGTYEGTAQVTQDNEGNSTDDEFDSYDVTVSVTVADHKITNVAITSPEPTDSTSKQRNDRAAKGYTKKDGTVYASIPDQIVEKNGTDGIDAVSTATVSSNVIKAAVDNALASASEEDPEPTSSVTSWTKLYTDLGISASSSDYDVVTSATNFTSRHAGDIATIVNKVTDDSGATTGLNGVNLTGKAATVTPKLSSATYNYSCNYGDGEFIIVPDDTVEGYTWNDFFDNAYAVTVSDGTTTVGALPWQDWYGEHATSGYHYNKFEVALNNGTSKGSNEGNVDRYAAFYDENGHVKGGSYTVVIYSEGYEPLVASDITVKPTPATAISASALSYSSTSLTISGLPEDIQNAKATVSYTTGRGRNAKTTTVADAVDVAADDTVALDTEQLKTLPDGIQLAVTVTSDNYADLSTTADYSIGYVYGYSGLTWAEYYANEAVENNTNVSSNSQVDSHGETDLGGFDVVTRATTNHGLHRGSFQTTATITTDAGNKYVVNSWESNGSAFYEPDGTKHAYSKGTIDSTEKLVDYEVSGLKYVPVAVRADQLDAYKQTHTFIENGSTLEGGYGEGNLKAYSVVSDVDENTNGLKMATVTTADDGTTSVSFSASKRDGTTSGIEDQELKTADLSSMSPIVASNDGSTSRTVGSFGETIRVDFSSGYGDLGANLQSVEWTYYGSDSTYSTAVATYGTKFAADNWMHKSMGIELGLSDSYRSPISSLEGGGVGYWKVTLHALGYKDASYEFEVTSANIADQSLATDEDKAALQTLVDQSESAKEAYYSATAWTSLQTELQETKDLLAKDTVYHSEATEQQTHLRSAIVDRLTVSWRDDYATVDPSVDTSAAEYDVVTSATTFTSRHAGDIASIVSKTTDDAGTTTGLDGVKLSGKEAAVTPQVSSATYSNSCNYGDGEFVIVPDDTVEGYTWNDFFDNAYAVTVSDGTTTVGALPWQDWYGEHATSGYHYNKFEVALNNGTSKGSNEGQISRYAAFYDENGNVKSGSYMVTIYSEGYEPLVASGITVLPTYTGTVAATGASSSDTKTTITGLPADIGNPKVTVSHTTGHGRSAVTTYYAQDADLSSDGNVSLDYDALAGTAAGTQLSVTITSDNYEPINLTLTVEEPALRFTDVDGTVAHEGDINWLADTGISTGWKNDDGTSEYRPYDSVARADMAAFVHRLAGNSYKAKTLSDVVFSDVSASTDHSEDIEWLAQNGISTGWDNGDGTSEYRPYANIARADMAAFLYRLAGSPEFDMSSAKGFTDVSEDTPHYKEILWMQATGISEGWDNGDGTSEYRPYANIARADMAAFLHRMAVKGLVDGVSV